MATKTSKYTIIDDRQFKGRQSRNLIRIIKMAQGRKLRIDIKRDSYDFQSHARIELWSDAEGKWNFVHSLPYPEMACVKSALDSSMYEDSATLTEIALRIIEA